jgi:PAS domain S-box-containing protein
MHQIALSKIIEKAGGIERFWHLIVETMSEALFLVDSDKNIIFWNKKAEELTGFAAKEVVNRHCLSGVKCDNCLTFCGLFTDNHEVCNREVILHRKDGVDITVRKNGAVIRAEDGTIIAGIEVFRDITSEQRQAQDKQAALEMAEHRRAVLEAILEGLSEGVIAFDEKLNAVNVSRRAADILGIDHETALGRSASAIFGAEISNMLARCAEEGRGCRGSRAVIPDSAISLRLAVNPFRVGKDLRGIVVALEDLREVDAKLRERARLVEYGEMISRTPAMIEIFDVVDTVARSNAAVLIEGESGTGKELVARELHKRGPRAAFPFHAVNCAALGRELLESEFFGHEKGSFTGAVSRKPGRFELAHRGTLFLDEVGELPVELQAKLLRVLQEQTFERVGGVETIKVDVRIVAATNRDLLEMARARLFREDLYYRLRVVPITLPPLRERPADIVPLVRRFIEQLNKREGRDVKRFDDEAMALLLKHRWPGNIRELHNVIEYAFAVSRDDFLGVVNLPPDIARWAFDDLFEAAAEISKGPLPDGVEAPHLPERERVLWALKRTGFNLAKAADLLGMDRSTLFRKRRKYGIE